MTKAKFASDPNDPRVGKQRLARETGLIRPHRRAVGAESAPEGVRLDRVRVVLVRTQFEGNLGRTARAMLNMGLTELHLVAPDVKHLSSAARRPAGHAWEVVKHAKLHDDLADALADTVFSIALTSARDRGRFPVGAYDEVLPRFAAAAQEGPVALVFGSEADGMTNREISLCSAAAQLACSAESPVLNLAQAVLLACSGVYTWRRPPEAPITTHPSSHPAHHEQLEGFFGQLFDLLDDVRFAKKQKLERFESNVRGMFTRQTLTRGEVAMLRGMLTAFRDGMEHPERYKGKKDAQARRGSGASGGEAEAETAVAKDGEILADTTDRAGEFDATRTGAESESTSE
jgi:TrmH family RNA methyltransferase